MKDICSYQGSFIHLSCSCEPLQPWIPIYIHIPPLAVALHPNTFLLGVCCLHFTASLIDLASPVSWGDLHLGQPNLSPSLDCRSQRVHIPPLIIFWARGNKNSVITWNYSFTVCGAAVSIFPLCTWPFGKTFPGTAEGEGEKTAKSKLWNWVYHLVLSVTTNYDKNTVLFLKSDQI